MEAEAPIYVVVCQYGAPETMLREDGTRYGPIVMETDVDDSALPAARARAADLEQRNAYGAARIARLVFEDVDGSPL